jgi:uncharacterized protein with GYD domain
MPKYLFHGSYTEEGLKGLLKDGGTKRMEETKKAVESLGGKFESYYFAFGDNDFYLIADIPERVSAIAGSLLVNVSGAVKAKITVLITSEEVDQAIKKTMEWRPPGQ